jgi:uncharacterized protein
LEGTNIAFDQESGALHVLDDLSFDVLNQYIQLDGKRPSDEALENSAISAGDSYADSRSCCEDIEELIVQGLLFTPAQILELKDFYKDEPRIKALCLHICHDCNLRCRYCFANTGDFHTGHRSLLDFETGKKAVDFVIAQSGTRHNIDIDFFGGEPLMNWDVVEALTFYCEEEGPKKEKNIRLTITTNAVTLDDRKTKFINEHMDNCVLSLDGRPQVNDFMRPGIGGKGTYDIVSKNIKDFIKKREDRSYYVRGTYTRHNLDFSNDVKHIVSLGIAQVSVEPVVGPQESDYALKTEDLPGIFREYEELARYYIESRKEGRPFEFFHFTMDLTNGPCAYKRLKGCGVGTEYIAVTPEGDIYPCHQFVGQTPFLLGNIMDDPIVLNQKVKDVFSDLLVPQKAECKNCWAKYFCSGGCPANAYFSTGSVQGTYKLGCEIQKKRLECALWIKTQLM